MEKKEMILDSGRIKMRLMVTEQGAWIENGKINGIELVEAPLSKVRIRRLSDGEEFILDSRSGFGRTAISRHKQYAKISLFCPLDGRLENFCIVIKIRTEGDRVDWLLSILNDNHDYSVLSAEYPQLKMAGTHLNVFVPYESGLVEEDVIERGYQIGSGYPSGHTLSMQYFAFYNEGKGIYAGTHDALGCHKIFTVNADKEERSCVLQARVPAIGMGKEANAFELPGKMVWQAFDGDWYEAANIYREFVRKEAVWIPEVDETGRFDTPQWFKELPFWIMDWMPNGENKHDELPTSIRPADGSVPSKDAWYEKAIRLQEELGVPIGYHLYNWHMIPFNNDYPHFYPPQEEAYEGIRKMREHQIYVAPYINGKLWDTKDHEDQDYLFSQKAMKWATRDLDGNIFMEVYESKEKNGEPVTLAGMCPSAGIWKSHLSDLIDKLKKDLKVPAVYIDQVTASVPNDCTAPEHNHEPGGGDWWRMAYTNMLERFQAEVGDDFAITSESNSETLMRGIDGYLTWLWLPGNMVPAFTRVYSGLAVFFGRNCNGKKKGDLLYFKHCLAQSITFGQQMGWINADVVDVPEKLSFLKKMVELRTTHTRFFNSGNMLRPPVVECDIEDREVEPACAHWGYPYDVPHIIRHVICGGWQLWDGSDTRILAVNLAEQEVNAVLRFRTAEYAGKAWDCILQGRGCVKAVRTEHEEIILEVQIAANDYIVI